MSREFRIPTQEELAKRNGLIIGLPQALLTGNPCQVYPRVSTPEQKENVSAEMQQDRKFALRCGWPDNEDMIIVETDDLGLSGQLRMEDRPAFVKMLRNIANGKVKTVIVANISRFFRRKWNDEAEKFMQICDTYGVKVVVPNGSRTAIKFIYDFSQRAHVEQFRRECEEAWNYLENHIYGTMHAAMDELGRAGFWTGGNLPIGYIVDRREKIDEKKNPDYQRFIPFEPHAKVIRWLFVRYWELGGRTLELLREIERKEYLFPAFSEDIDKEIVSRFVNPKVLDQDGKIKGYTIKSDRGLRSILTNVAYIGYWTYKGELTSTDNHDPIVDFNKFAYAFHRLSTIRLDGTQNKEVLERRKQYEKKHFAEHPALLNGQLEASDPNQRIHVCINPLKSKEAREGTGPQTISYYGFYRRRAGADKSVKYMISSPDLDGIFLKHFIGRLQEANARLRNLFGKG